MQFISMMFRKINGKTTLVLVIVMSAIENAASNVIKKLRDNKIKADILNSKDYKDFAQYFKNGVKEKDLDPDFKSAFNNYIQYYKEIMNNAIIMNFLFIKIFPSPNKILHYKYYFFKQLIIF